MRKNLIWLLSFILLTSFPLQGCTVLPNKPYLKQDTTGVEPLKVVRYDTAPLRAYKTGNMISAIVVSGVLFGGIGAGIGYVIHRNASIEPENPDVPDFGKLLVAQFSERAKKEIPQWPAMSIVQEPVKQDYLNDKSAYIVEIKVEDVRIEMESGVVIESTIVMKDKSNNAIWEKGYQYDAFNFQRLKNYDTLMRDKCKGLKEEFEFAAEKTISDFIAHFNDSMNLNKKEIKKNL